MEDSNQFIVPTDKTNNFRGMTALNIWLWWMKIWWIWIKTSKDINKYKYLGNKERGSGWNWFPTIKKVGHIKKLIKTKTTQNINYW